MKLSQFIFGFLFIALLFSCSTKRKDSHLTSTNDQVLIRQDFKKYFDECNVEGAIAIYDNQKHTWILSDTIATRKETLPASFYF